MKKNKKTQEQRDLLIAQSNDLVRARYSTSIWEKRLFIEMLQHIKVKDKEFKKTRFYYTNLLKTYQSTSNDDYRKISQAAEALGRKVMFLRYVSENGERRKVSEPVVKVDMPEELQDGHNKYLELKFNDVLKPLLLQLSKNYFLYDKANIIGIRKKYTFDFYEIFKKAEWESKNKVVVKFEIKKLRDLILVDIKGNPTNQYKKTNDFERYVIKPTQQEIEKQTDLRFTYEKKKKGNKVVEIWFTVYKNRKQNSKIRENTIKQQLTSKISQDQTTTPKAPTPNNPIHNNQAYQKLIDIGVTIPTAYELVQSHDTSYILTSIQQAQKAHHTNKKMNFAGFIISCIKQGTYKKIHEKKQAKKTKEQTQQKKQNFHYKIMDIENTYQKERNYYIDLFRDKLNEETTAEAIKRARTISKRVEEMTVEGIKDSIYFGMGIVTYFDEIGKFPKEFVSFDNYMQKNHNIKVSRHNSNNGWYEIVN